MQKQHKFMPNKGVVYCASASAALFTIWLLSGAIGRPQPREVHALPLQSSATLQHEFCLLILAPQTCRSVQ